MQELAIKPAAPSTISSYRWQLLLALLVGSVLTGLIASMLMAAREVTGVADADYYQHGLHYGRTRTGANNPGLWWQISTVAAGDVLQVKVTDRGGAPVSGGELKFDPEQATASTAPKFKEISPGTFEARQIATLNSISPDKGGMVVPAPPNARFHGGEFRGTLRYSRGEAFATRKVVLLN